jgi:uncharacterized protein YlxP (DUF503 family)
MLRLRLHIAESSSLKDKRQVVRSLSQRIRNKFQAAVAEVDDNEAWQVATLGIAVVSNSYTHCEDVLREIAHYARDSRLDAEVIEESIEVVAFDDG